MIPSMSEPIASLLTSKPSSFFILTTSSCMRSLLVNVIGSGGALEDCGIFRSRYRRERHYTRQNKHISIYRQILCEVSSQLIIKKSFVVKHNITHSRATIDSHFV